MSQLGFLDPLARGAVKQNRVAICLPNCREFHATGSVEAKEDAARTMTADQNSFGNVKSSGLQLVLFAKAVVNVGSKVAQILNVEWFARHESADSSRMNDFGWEKLPTGKIWQFREGVSRSNYRPGAQTDLSGKVGKMTKDRLEAADCSV